MNFLVTGPTKILSCLALGTVLLSPAGFAQERPRHPGEFQPGRLNRIDELPAGRFRTRLEQLPATARNRALQRLRGFHFTTQDLPALETDPEGEIYYADSFTLPAASDAETPAGGSSEPGVAQAPVPVSPFPAGLVFHSRPGSANVIFLNFCGSTVTNTAWNTSLGKTNVPAVAFSTDADFTTFSDSEQTVIKRVWLRVAEDYAPFDVDVTTEPPATMTATTAEALITRNTDADGSGNPSSTAGGVAYVGVFGSSSYYRYRPAWIYYNNLANTESYIAEAASHEIGHNLGLSHDGLTDGSAYYGGHGTGDISWGPIMGTGYGRNVSQWSDGEYYLANNTQDDLATIAAHIPYRTDDHGDTAGTATPIVFTSGTNIVVTTPDTDPTNLNPANKGVIEHNTDVDVFSFSTGNGPINIAINPWIMPSGTRGGNVDLSVELRNSSGTVITTNNPATQTLAQIQTTLTAGTYYLYIRNSGAGDPLSTTPSGFVVYGSIGQYFISGYVSPSIRPIAPTNLKIVAN